METMETCRYQTRFSCICFNMNKLRPIIQLPPPWLYWFTKQPSWKTSTWNPNLKQQ